MRRLVLIIGVLALTLPAVAGALSRGPGDRGTLVVDNAQGVVELRVRGGIIGRFDSGTIEVTDFDGNVGPAPVLNGCQDLLRLGPRRTECGSLNEVRFKLIGGFYRVRITGIGMDVSVNGRGSVLLDGTGYMDQSGRYSFNGGSYRSFPHVPTKLFLGTPAPATLGSK
jgi:hypothetical protein